MYQSPSFSLWWIVVGFFRTVQITGIHEGMKVTGNVDFKVSKLPKGSIMLDEIFKIRSRKLMQHGISLKKIASSTTIT